jgi:hypothetical protein
VGHAWSLFVLGELCPCPSIASWRIKCILLLGVAGRPWIELVLRMLTRGTVLLFVSNLLLVSYSMHSALGSYLCCAIRGSKNGERVACYMKPLAVVISSQLLYKSKQVSYQKIAPVFVIALCMFRLQPAAVFTELHQLKTYKHIMQLVCV